MSIIPASGKPIELDLDKVKNAQDADRAILWLNSVLADMNQQIEDRGTEDQVWLAKIRAAQRATSNKRHLAIELRDGFKGESALHSSFMRNALAILDANTFNRIVDEMVKEDPSLDGLLVPAERI